MIPPICFQSQNGIRGYETGQASHNASIFEKLYHNGPPIDSKCQLQLLSKIKQRFAIANNTEDRLSLRAALSWRDIQAIILRSPDAAAAWLPARD
jgi:hypothetical protein